MNCQSTATRVPEGVGGDVFMLFISPYWGKVLPFYNRTINKFIACLEEALGEPNRYAVVPKSYKITNYFETFFFYLRTLKPGENNVGIKCDARFS